MNWKALPLQMLRWVSAGANEASLELLLCTQPCVQQNWRRWNKNAVLESAQEPGTAMYRPSRRTHQGMRAGKSVLVEKLGSSQDHVILGKFSPIWGTLPYLSNIDIYWGVSE